MDLDLGQILSDGVKVQIFLKSLTPILHCCSQLIKQEKLDYEKEKREQKRVRKEKNWSDI